MPGFTENDLLNARNEVARLQAEHDSKRLAADNQVEEIRASGVDPSTDEDAFTRVDEAYKVADELADKLVKARHRADRIMDSLGKRPEKRTAPNGDEGEGEERPAVLDVRLLGKRLVEHENYARIRELAATDIRAAAAFMQANPTQIASQDEVEALLRAITIPTSPSPLIPPDYRPPVDVIYRPTRILDLITIGNTGSDLVQFVVEVYHAPAAAETEDGDPTVDGSGELPEEDFEFVPAETGVKRIGGATPARESQLSDAGQLQTLVSKGLITKTRQHTEDRVIAGNGVGDNLKGILNTTGIGSVTLGSTGHAGETPLDAIHRGITACRLAFVEPNGIAMDPVDYEQDIVLAKDSVGNYLFKIGEPSSVWGKPTAVTTAVPNGTTVVADFSHAILLIRTPIVVLASNEHKDFFTRGLVEIKAEYRGAFYVDRPAAFTEVTGI